MAIAAAIVAGASRTRKCPGSCLLESHRAGCDHGREANFSTVSVIGATESPATGNASPANANHAVPAARRPHQGITLLNRAQAGMQTSIQTRGPAKSAGIERLHRTPWSDRFSILVPTSASPTKTTESASRFASP
ncbi:hypothetical protein ABIA26_001665 [Sinorhizobium fredii]